MYKTDKSTSDLRLFSHFDAYTFEFCLRLCCIFIHFPWNHHFL